MPLNATELSEFAELLANHLTIVALGGDPRVSQKVLMEWLGKSENLENTNENK